LQTPFNNFEIKLLANKQIKGLQNKQLKLIIMKCILKNKEVRIFSLGIALIAVISLGIFMQACSNEENDYATVLSESEMSYIAADYLIFEDGKFFLNISEKAAIKLGISEFYYQKMLNEIEKTNAFIKENNLEESIQISFEEWRKKDISTFIPRLKNGDVENNGTLWSFPNSSTGTSRSFNYSNGQISFYANSTCFPVTVISISINCGGTIINTSITLYPFGNNSKTVQLPYNSGSCSITVNTTCSNGSSLVVK
jgi:hypothetical protein